MRRDGRVLVLVDGRDVGGQWSRAVLGPALRHLGIPHRFWNVAHVLKPDVTVLATGDGYPILWARGLEDRGCYAAAADPRGDSVALAW